MSKLKEITGFDRGKKEIMNYKIPAGIIMPPLSEVLMLALADEEGKYLYKLMKIEPVEDNISDVAVESISINLNDIKEVFTILTNEQRNLVMHVYYLYKTRSYETSSDESNEKNIRIILQGPAGTGKSTIISLIEKLITWEENKTSDTPHNLKVIKCAFTGKAASTIEGSTLNHLFSLPIPIYKTRSLTKKRLGTKQEVLKDCVLFICDEISMVGEKTMKAVNFRLQQIFENDKLYGGRFVLLVGDLYQIDPVMQKPIYPGSKYWTCCEFYELTKIMRQQDENFIKALNNFRDSKMTKNDIRLLKSREIQHYDEVPDSAIHIFYQNKYVDMYNTFKLNKSNAKEEVVNTVEDSDQWEPSQLRVKIGIRYMITYNMDVSDGLANGTTGIVKDFDYDKHDCVSAVWMEFHSNAIGRKAKAEYLRKHGNSKPGRENWVPIQRLSMKVKLKTSPKVTKTVGKIFHLRAAEAITVHKSQGQTYHEGVCVHFTEDARDKLRTDKSLQYVALTRVTRLDNLYIMGDLNFSVPKSKKFIRTEEELNYLRSEKKLKLAFETFEGKLGDVIIYLNTGATFNEHHEFITSDKWYGNASLLIFTETNTVSSDQIEIPNFDIAFRSEYKTTSRSGGGMICYKQKSKKLKIVCSFRSKRSKMYLAVLLFENVFIVAGVKADATGHEFAHSIINIISSYVQNKKCIFFIGDFNQSMSNTIEDVLKSQNIKKDYFSCDILDTNDNNTKCDVVFTRHFRIQRNQIGCYQYIPSSHNPIYVKLPPKPQLYSESQSEESESMDEDSQSSNGQSHPADSESLYENGQSDSEDMESQSINGELHPYESRNGNGQSNFEDSESDNMESQSFNGELRPENKEPQCENDLSDSEDCESDSESREPDSESRESDSEDNMESQSTNDESHSEDSESQYENGQSHSENTECQSSDSEYGCSQPLSELMDSEDFF